MKNIFLIRLSILLLFATTFTSNVSGREIYDFNRDWKLTTEMTNLDRAKIVNLPYVNSNSEGCVERNGGSCYFIKEFRVPYDWSGKKVFIRFGGATNVATVLVNGRYGGVHAGQATGFTFDISSLIKPGMVNSVLVNVSTVPRLDLLPLSTEKTNFCGIHGNVEIIVASQTHITPTHYGSDGLYIDTKGIDGSEAQLSARVMVKGKPKSTVEVVLDIFDGAENVMSTIQDVTIDAKGDGIAKMNISLKKAKLWGGSNGSTTYRAVATTKVDGSETDRCGTLFGIRSVAMGDGNKFMLNNEEFVVRGVTHIQDRSEVGSAFRELHQIEDVNLISEMGATAVRFPTGVLSRNIFKLLDKKGIVAWIDLPLSSESRYYGKGFINSYALKESGKKQLLELVYQYYNHPSVCFWGVFNEITTTGDNPISYIKQLNSMIHLHSPGRLTVGSSIEDGEINTITDAIAWPVEYGVVNGSTSDFDIWAEQIATKYSYLKGAISEYGAPADIYTPTNGENIMRVQKLHSNKVGYPEESQAYFHEQYLKTINKRHAFWGTFINSMFDYTVVGDGYQQYDKVNDMGLVSYDRHNKKDAFYLYKASWNKTSPFVHITNKNSNKVSSKTAKIRAYTNQPSATLTLNGTEIGSVDAVDGIVEWSGVELKSGINKIVVNSGDYSDKVDIRSFSSL